MTTGEMLDALAKIGKPWVYRTDRGWGAKLDMPAPTGTTLEVRSEGNHPTHESALTELIVRLGSIVELGATITRAIEVRR